MPWHINSNCAGCPKRKPYGVVRGHKGTHGHIEGCHPTREAANQQLKALYASEDDMNVKSLIAAGFTPESAAEAAATDNANALVRADANVHAANPGDTDDATGDAEAPGVVGTATDDIYLHNLHGQLAGTKVYAEGYLGDSAGIKDLVSGIAASHATHMSNTASLLPAGGGMYSNSSKAPTEARAMTGTKAPVKKAPYGNVSYADPGYQKDGKKRYPIDTKAHVQAAWSYINKPGNASAYSSTQLASIKAKIKSAAKKFGITISANSRPNVHECLRSFAFENTVASDGRTMEGYAAVFNSTSRIADWGGDFDEVILPGAFARSLEKRTPVLQFDHGKDTRVGSVPIGAIDDIHEDARGLYVRARLFDNPVVEPVRQAIEGGAINGMSFRFSVPEGGDKWTTRSNDVELREISDTDTRECGPVVFPAYDSTSVSVRTLISQLDPDEHRALVRELADEVTTLIGYADLEDLAVDLEPGGSRDSETDAQPGSGEASTDPLSARMASLAMREMAIRHSAAYVRETNA